MSEKNVVLYDSDEAAQLKTVTGWVSRDGHYYGNEENIARYAGSTHKKCDCGSVVEKGSRCRACESKRRTDAYYALPMETWDGTQPIALWDDDRFFFDEDSFLDFLFDMKQGTPGDIPEVQAVLCTPHRLGLISIDNWADDLPDDGELPPAVAAKVDELNEAIKAAPVASWFPGKVRIDMELLWEKVGGQTCVNGVSAV